MEQVAVFQVQPNLEAFLFYIVVLTEFTNTGWMS